MPVQRRMDRKSAIALGAALALVGAFSAAPSVNAEIFKKEDLLRGIAITHEQCDATNQTLWLTVHGRDFCVRYYLSTAGGEGKRPVVFLQGDQLGKYNWKTWSWTDTSEARDVDTADIIRGNDQLSKLTKTTAIYVGRIGVDGTSGNHLSRKSVLELDLMNAALDALKQRYGFEGYHLAGQSGGSSLVAGLAERRNDIGCVVIGSGRILSPDLPASKDIAKSQFDPTEKLSQLVQNRALHIFVVTDKADKRVPASQQIGLVERLRKAGRPVPQFFVEATDDLRHGVVAYTQLVSAGCILDRPDDEIAHALATLTKRDAEYNDRRRKEAKDKPAILAAARQTVAGSSAVSPPPRAP